MGATSMNKYTTNKAWADQYTEQVIALLVSNAAHIVKVEVAPQYQDSHNATDMIIQVVGGCVAVRIRRDTERRDLTIRATLPSGAKTELQKIREGFANWYLYAWTQSGQICEWILVDLNRLRTSGTIFVQRAEIPNGYWESNKFVRDGTYFVAIPLAELLANNCIVASS